MIWNKSLETGIKLIDDEHKELFKKADEALNSSIQKKGMESIEQSLNFLTGYVQTHFSHEEELQKKSLYPKFIEHQRLHSNFVLLLGNLQKKFRTEGATLELILSTNKAFVDWLTNHINIHDKEFAGYYKNKANK